MINSNESVPLLKNVEQFLSFFAIIFIKIYSLKYIKLIQTKKNIKNAEQKPPITNNK